MDLAGDIQSEYHRYLNPRGEPGVGDRFYREIINSGNRIERVELLRLPDGTYPDFPTDLALDAFDPSDRKFAALSRVANAAVVNATDSDWLDHRAALAKHGITVEFACGCDRSCWFED